MVFHTTSSSAGAYVHGIGAVSISAGGHPGPQVTALSGWNDQNQPGLVVLPGGTLEAVFGGGGPSTNSYAGPFGIISTDGGNTWSPPVDVGSQSIEPFPGAIAAQMSGATPVLALPMAGTMVVQQGFGLGSITSPLGPWGLASSAVDAASGEVVVASAAGGEGTLVPSGHDFMQGVAPTVQSQQTIGGLDRDWIVMAGRDHGPGVFVPYTTDERHIRLLQYGTGSVPVGTAGANEATFLAAATGLDGRIWVMWWGNKNAKGELALTRSNKAVTRFEPIQHYSLNVDSLGHLDGDGRLGPLDLLVNEIPIGTGATQGLYYARVLPELSASVSVKKLGAGKFTLIVDVSDAGDAVPGAHVAASGQSATTNALSKAALTVTGTAGASVQVRVTASGYQPLKTHVSL